MRTPLIAGNWKMYKTGPEAADTAGRLAELAADAAHTEVMIAPPFTALALVNAAIAGSRIQLGGQNLHWEAEGAFTGEVSAAMLVAVGCRYVIIGHSERRQYFGETDASVNRKITAAVDAGLSPILCVGESEDEREDGQTFSVLDKQLNNGLQDMALEVLERLVMAYEPVWAIAPANSS
jgi:triosephosphate isomerase